MSLHVKLEMLITQVLPLHCQRKKLQNLSHLNCGLQIREICIQLITACGNTAREGVQNTHHWSGWTKTATKNGVPLAGSRLHCGSHSSMAWSIVAGQWCVFCIPLLQYFPHAVINCIQIWRIWMPQLRWDKFWSLSNNSIVARVRWAFQVSQGSVETVFRWGGKRLHDFVANLFRKLCIKLHHNCPSFVGDITKNILVCFPGHSVLVCLLQ